MSHADTISTLKAIRKPYELADLGQKVRAIVDELCPKVGDGAIRRRV